MLAPSDRAILAQPLRRREPLVRTGKLGGGRDHSNHLGKEGCEDASPEMVILRQRLQLLAGGGTLAGHGDAASGAASRRHGPRL